MSNLPDPTILNEEAKERPPMKPIKLQKAKKTKK